VANNLNFCFGDSEPHKRAQKPKGRFSESAVKATTRKAAVTATMKRRALKPKKTESKKY